MHDFAGSSQRRLEAARQVAVELQHDERLHRLAMKAVFVLEDCHEAFVRMSAGQEIRAEDWRSPEVKARR